jgi:hypothetical protein
MNENAEFYFQCAAGLFLITLAFPFLCRKGCDIDELNFYLLGFAMLVASTLLMTVWGIYEIYYPSPSLSATQVVNDFIKEIPKLILLSIAGSLYWFVSEHGKFQANKQLGMKVFGGKRK